jgi:hypothetical protein
MGAPSAQIQSPQSSSSGKGNQITDQIISSNATQDSPQPSIGKGMQGSQGAVTFPGQGGQPEMGMPNAYSNTVGPVDQGFGGQQGSWDNSPKPMGKGSAGSSGKGKGA